MKLPANFPPALHAHYGLLQRWNGKLNLVSHASLACAAERHYGEALFLASRLPGEPLRVVDVGSGAGFPGFVIAVMRPDCEVTLVESDQRKASFLREASRGIRNVRVLALRAESIDEHFDWLTLRAVRWEREFARLASHYALLIGERDAGRLPGGIAWLPPERLPGSLARVLCIGHHVPRETL